MNTVQILENESSGVSISQDVILKMVEQIVEEIDGAEIINNEYNGLKDMVSKKSLVKSLITEFDEEGVAIDLNVAVEYGKKVHEVAQKVQSKITQEIETLAGVKVNFVNVTVVDII